MNPPTRIAVGSDGSATANRAVEVASMLALAFDVPLVVVTAWSPDTDDSMSVAEWAQTIVADASAVARMAGVADVRSSTPVGSPGPVLENLAVERPGTLIVVGAIGRSAGSGRRLGTIPHHLTHHAPGDLVLVRSSELEREHDWSSIALTTDGSETSVHAATVGLALARAIDATPVLISAGGDDAELERTLLAVADRIDDGGGPLELEIALGEDVSETLSDAVAHYGVVVLGNRRMQGMRRLLGSVPNDLTHQLPTDILLVNSPG